MKYKLIEKEGSAFDIEDIEEQMEMIYSMDDAYWTSIWKGKKAVVIKSDGNGLEIQIPEANFKKYFNYGVASYLLHALKAWDKLHKYTFTKYTMYKEVK